MAVTRNGGERMAGDAMGGHSGSGTPRAAELELLSINGSPAHPPLRHVEPYLPWAGAYRSHRNSGRTIAWRDSTLALPGPSPLVRGQVGRGPSSGRLPGLATDARLQSGRRFRIR
jgi:hypothetical protein